LPIAFLFAAAAGGHICDNIFWQPDKLVIKPEVTGLILKDRGSFKMHVQNNMDRPVTRYVRLVGRSEAFDVHVAPRRGYKLEKGERREYEVTLTVKGDVPSGEYPVHFDVMGGSFKMRSYTVASVRKGAAGVTRAPVLAGAGPAIDGSVRDPCWTSALLLRPKSNTKGVAPSRRTTALVTADESNIYVCASAFGEEGDRDGTEENSVSVLLSPPDSSDVYAFRVEEDGDIYASVRRLGVKTALDSKLLKVRSAVQTWNHAWNAELCIPLGSVGAGGKLENRIWRLNIIRESGQGPAETSFWAGTPGTYATLEGLGEVVFSH